MSISQCFEKKVVVLYFINPGYSVPVSTQKTCDIFDSPRQINLKINLFCITDEMIEKDGQKLIAEIQSVLAVCTEFVIRMIDLSSLRFHFLESLVNDPRHSFFYYTPSDDVSILKVCSKKFKIFNLLSSDKHSFVEETRFSDPLTCEFNIIHIPRLRYMMDKMQPTLECMSWFKHYLKKAFECASGRLLQIAATCFLNSVINGLFLSPGTQALMLQEYVKNGSNEYPDIESLACPSQDTQNSKKFILTLVDALLIKRKRLRRKTLDILVQGSAGSFSVDSSGSHGSPLFSIIQIFISLGINFLLKIPQFYYIDPTYDLTELFSSNFVRVEPKVQYVLPFPISRSDFYEAIKRNQLVAFLKKFSRDKKFTMEKTDILIEYQNVFQYKEKPEIKYENDFQIAHTILEREGVQFDLQFCNLVVDFLTRQKTFFSHALVGIICNGIHQLYDSQLNLFFEFNWQSMNKNEEFIAEIEYRHQATVLNYNRDFTVYIRSSLAKEIQIQQQRNFTPTEDIF